MKLFYNIIIFYNSIKKMSYPPPITKIELRVSTGSSTNVEIFEQDISPSALSGTTNNSVQIMPNTSVFNAFNTKPPGTIFNSAIVATYNDDIFGPEYIVITPNWQFDLIFFIELLFLV